MTIPTIDQPNTARTSRAGAARTRAVNPSTTIPRWLGAVWHSRRRRWGSAAVVVAASGVLAAGWTPRGPVTMTEGLGSMVLATIVGALAGLFIRSRWAVVLAPLGWSAVFELGRASFSGPTVDGIHLGSEYGVMAFMVGRGAGALLILVPMALGATVGAGLARKTLSTNAPVAGWRSRSGRVVRRSVAVCTALSMTALGFFVAQPASTAAITGADGSRVAGSVAELTRVEIGGHSLSMMIRGRSTSNPVLLFLAGGPGGTELGALRRHGQLLEKDFTVVTYDQRGTGRSYDQIDPLDTLTLEAAIQDSLGVTNYLRARFHQDKIYLVGQSWGTILGVLAVQRQPQLFRAFVGTGQMVSPRATDIISYRDTLAWARSTDNSGLVDTLTRSGPPPYADPLDYEAALSYESEVYPYDHTPNAEGAGQMSENIFVEEYSLLDKVHIFAGFLDVFTTLYPQLQDIDFRTQATSLAVPVYLVEGRHEARGRAEPVAEWFASLTAPSKRLVVFETSGHRPMWEQPVQFSELMTRTVLAETAPPA